MRVDREPEHHNLDLPKVTEHSTDHGVDDQVQLMCKLQIDTNDRDAILQHAAPDWIDKKDLPKPRLMSQLAGGFNLGDRKRVKEVRNDS